MRVVDVEEEEERENAGREGGEFDEADRRNEVELR